MTHPMRTKLRLFLEWGITFGKPYILPERMARKVAYADKQSLMRSIRAKTPSESDPSDGKPTEQQPECDAVRNSAYHLRKKGVSP